MLRSNHLLLVLVAGSVAVSACSGGAATQDSPGSAGSDGGGLHSIAPSVTEDPTPAGYIGEIRHPSTGPCAVTSDPESGRTWVSYANTRQINEVDPVSGATVATLDLDGTRPCALQYLDGSLWVGIFRDAVMQRIDPASGEVTAEIALVGGVNGMLTAFGHLWVLDRSGPVVMKIDPTTATQVASVRVEGSPRGMVATDEGIWLVREIPGVVSLIDPEAVTIVEEVNVAPGIRGLVAGEGALWTTRARFGTVFRIDLADRSVGEPIAVGDDPRGISFGHGYVWIGDVAGQLAQVDPRSGQVAGRYPFAVGTFGGIPVGDQLWVVEPDRIVQIDPAALG
jgi:streptogramin lyase